MRKQIILFMINIVMSLSIFAGERSTIAERVLHSYESDATFHEVQPFQIASDLASKRKKAPGSQAVWLHPDFSEATGYLPSPDLIVRPDFCRGLNNAFWNSIPGATKYEVWLSNSSTFFPGAYKYAETSATYMLLDVPSNQHVWVKACNNGSCSPISNKQVAKYYSPPCY